MISISDVYTAKPLLRGNLRGVFAPRVLTTRPAILDRFESAAMPEALRTFVVNVPFSHQ